MSVQTVKVVLWGTPIGYLHRQNNGIIGFQYDDLFLKSGIEISPIMMPLSDMTYSFPSLSEETFSGLPGMVADSLPDRFGNIVIKRYLKSTGRGEESLTPLEKLCYTGKRGMGALEYEPSEHIIDANEPLNINALTKLASEILSNKENLHITQDDKMIAQLMQSSSSVGGARAKTLIAWNRNTGDVRSGQVNAGEGYEYWLLKFDNIDNNRDKDSEADSKEYTKIEYAYYLMAISSGIEMNESLLYHENRNAHFITKRFDRIGINGEKLHMQSLCALAHMDFNSPRFYSYEDAFNVMQKLRLPHDDFIQLYKRMVFNEFAKNYDDHTKNIAFLMNKAGEWSLAPAFDMTYSYKKDSIWVSAHQMLINGKADEITIDDLISVADKTGIKKATAKECIDQIQAATASWLDFAEQAELSPQKAKHIQKQLRR